jgi:serine/threonine protein phosphatase PrpC
LVPYVRNIENEVIAQLKVSRGRNPGVQMNCRQLTRDQKPEDSDEFQRIISCGGKVKRLGDEDGNKVGPYRVWESEGNAPGLTMTRSIGDQEAKSLGVISTPIVTHHKLDLKHDLFIVVASDGIWNCMDNDDVANFVEFYRPMSCKEIIRHKDTEVSVSNSCIAQLLCEEARVRWLSVVEEDDVMIDDISCVVLELVGVKRREAKAQTRPLRVNKPEKATSPMPHKKNSTVIDSEPLNLMKAPTIKGTGIRDPRRASNVFGNV